MPIYEFFCQRCNTLFNFLSSRVNTGKIPLCPECRKPLARQVSRFATIGRAKEPAADGIPDLDEARMERVLGELAREAEGISEDDPRQMARFMRKFTEKSGLSLGGGMEEALARLESGEDPERIEAEMGDVLEGEDPLSMMAAMAQGKKGQRQAAPRRDETLYDLDKAEGA